MMVRAETSPITLGYAERNTDSGMIVMESFGFRANGFWVVTAMQRVSPVRSAGWRRLGCMTLDVDLGSHRRTEEPAIVNEAAQQWVAGEAARVGMEVVGSIPEACKETAHPAAATAVCGYVISPPPFTVQQA